MARPRKNPEPLQTVSDGVPHEAVKVAKVSAADALVGVPRSDLPALLARAKAEGDSEGIAAILAACSK